LPDISKTYLYSHSDFDRIKEDKSTSKSKKIIQDGTPINRDVAMLASLYHAQVNNCKPGVNKVTS